MGKTKIRANCKQAIVCTISLFTVCFLVCQQAQAKSHDNSRYKSYQDAVIHGTVTDTSGTGLGGVSIFIVGTKKGTITSSSGAFTINASKGDVLEISMVGYEKKTITLGSEENISIQLVPVANSLQDVVMIGYGTQKRKEVTGALSSISTKEYSQQQVTNVSQVLQGRAAGVQVADNSGAPGGAVSVRIRGNNSIVGDNNPLYVVDGFVGVDISSVNPNDITSVSVLKDASATAIYGSRGANGVVLIATKKGNAAHPQVELNTAWSSSKVLKKLDVMDAADFATTANAYAQASGTKLPFTDTQIQGFQQNGGTNWQDEIFRTAPTQEYQLNLAGGGGKTSYYVSGNYLDQQGIIINSYAKRYALRANINSHVSDKFTVRVNTYAARTESDNTSITGRNSPVTQAIGWSPVLPVRDSLGRYILSDPYSSITNNPAALAASQDNILKNSSFLGILGLNYAFTPGLSLDVTGGVNYNNQQGYTFMSAAANNPNPAKASRASLENVGLQNTENLTYDHVFNNVHHLTATGVFEIQSVSSNSFGLTANNLTFPNLIYYGLAQAGNYSGITSPYSFYQLMSFLGRVAYDYNGQYFITATVRRDGSSKFAPGHQYSTFPSVGIAWDLSKYDFIKNSGVIDNLKIRAGYGVTGNQAVNPYQTMVDQYGNVNSSFTTGTITPGIVMGNPGNTNLKWETTKQTDIGLDADFFKGRLSLSADYYNKNTTNLLFPLPIPDYLGGGFELSNIGEVNNHGVELSVSGDIVRSNSVVWNSSLNYSLLRNKLVSLYNNINQIPSNGTALGQTNVGQGLSSQPEFMLMTGQPLGTYWGLTYLGTWKPSEATQAALYNQNPGDSHYEDLDGNHVINGNDYHAIGSGLPKYSWGWNNTITWKGLTLNVFIQSLGGYKKLDYTYAAGITANSDIKEATLAEIKNRYISGQNETSNIPAFSKTNVNYTQSTRFLEDGTFVRFKNISLSYTLPKTVLKKANLTLFARGANLITITKYKGFDPESNNVSGAAGSDIAQSIDYGSYPNAKTYTFGLKLDF